MHIEQTIQQYSAQPLTHQLLLSLLKDYKRPNDKVHDLLRAGWLQSVKKGLYVAGPSIQGTKPESFLVANHIMGPSYISSDAALSYYGLIPERVYEITSMTTKASRTFATPLGLFSYARLPLPYYAFDIRRVELSVNQFAMVASPEKAFFDKVITTSGLIFRSQKGVISYLLEDQRMDEDAVKSLDTTTMLTWLPNAPKKDSLSMLIKAIQSL